MRLSSSLALCVTLALAAGCEKKKPERVRGSGVQGTEQRDAPAASKLRVGGPLVAFVTVGRSTPLELKGDDNLLREVVVRKDGDVLVINTARPVRTKQPLEARIGLERLEALTLVGSGNVSVKGITGTAFQVQATGAAKLSAEGSAERLTVTAKKAARLDFGKFSTAQATVVAQEAARVQLGYVEALNVTQEGPSRVMYRGDPTLERKVAPPARLVRQP